MNDKRGFSILKRKLLALLSVSVLALFVLAGCGNFYSKVMTIDGIEISSGLYLYYQLNAYYEARATMEDSTADVFREKIDGQSASSWIQAKAEENCRRHVAIQRLCAEHNVVLSEENRAALDEQLNYWSYMSYLYENNGIGEESFRLGAENEVMGKQLFETLYAVGGPLAPTEEEIKAAYTAQNAHLRYISVPLTKTDYSAYENPEEIVGKVDEMLAELKGGATLEDVANGKLVGIYELLGRDFTGTTPDEVIYDSFFNYEESDEYYTEEFLTGLKALSVGSFGTYRMETSIMLYEVIPAFESDEDYETRRPDIIVSLYTETHDDWLAEIYNAYPVSKVFGAQNYYSPKKIELNYGF